MRADTAVAAWEARGEWDWSNIVNVGRAASGLFAGALPGRWRQLGAVFAVVRALTADAPNARIMLDAFIPLGAFATFTSDVGIEL